MTADPRDRAGRTPLHYAAGDGEVDRVTQLLATGADVDARERDGYTPLHFAAQNGAHAAIELLLAAGADIDARSDDGQTPLWRACRASPDESTAALLLRHGADPWNDEHGGTVVEFLRGLSNRPGYHALFAGHFAELDRRIDARDTPLHRAARNGSVSAARELLDAGACCDSRDIDGRTPLHVALVARADDVATLLLERGADPNAADRGGVVPLRLSFMRTSRVDPVDPVVATLVAHGADPHHRDTGGQSPHLLAATNERPDLCAAMGVEYNTDRLPCCGYRPRRRR